MADLQRIDLSPDVKAELGELVYQNIMLRAQNRVLAQRLNELEAETPIDGDQPADPARSTDTSFHDESGDHTPGTRAGRKADRA